MKRDPRARFRFAACQSPAGRKLLREYGIGSVAERSLVLIRGDRIYLRSDAALRIAAHLSGCWPLFSAGIVFPRFLRDFFYGLVARNRYRLYGRREECYIPEGGLRNRFIE